MLEYQSKVPLFPDLLQIVLVDTMFYAAITPLLLKLVDDLDLGKNGAGVLTGAYAAGTLLGSLPRAGRSRARA